MSLWCGLARVLGVSSFSFCFFFSHLRLISCQFANGWVHGEQLCENTKVHPLLKPYRALAEKVDREVRFYCVCECTSEKKSSKLTNPRDPPCITNVVYVI